MNEDKKTKEKDYSQLIKPAISAFYKERTEKSLIMVLCILSDSLVWIPCNTVMGQKDQEQLEAMLQQAKGDGQSLVGRDFTTQEPVRLVPDILQKGESYYFPVFSSAEEMGEYGDRFSKVEKPFMEALEMAKHNQKYELAGMVINAFTEPMELPWDLLQIIEDHKSGEPADETSS